MRLPKKRPDQSYSPSSWTFRVPLLALFIFSAEDGARYVDILPVVDVSLASYDLCRTLATEASVVASSMDTRSHPF